MRIINIQVGLYSVINERGRWAYSIKREGNGNWVIREVDTYGNQWRVVGAYASLDEAKAAVNA